MAKFIPLHIHSEFSLLDGTIRIGDLVNYAKENELPGNCCYRSRRDVFCN